MITSPASPPLPLPLPPLPTPEQALRSAVHHIHEGEADAARVCVELAREIREGSTRPLVDRALDRLTLHDVEGIVCSHGRVAVRRKNAQPSGWYLHTDDGSNCAKPSPETEHGRRLSADLKAAVENRVSGAFADVPQTRAWTGTPPRTPAPVNDVYAYDSSRYDEIAHVAAEATAKLDTSRLRPQLAENLPTLSGQPAGTPEAEVKCRHRQCRRTIVRRQQAGVWDWVHKDTGVTPCRRPLSDAHAAPTFAEPEPPK